MLTDMRLQKYLEGRLPRTEARELEALLEKSPELRERLEALKAAGDGPHIGQMRRRRHLDHDVKRGSRIRTGTVLPALVLLLIVLGLASHWFAPIGSNSTFAVQASTGRAIELLYDSPQGWRYFDAGFKPGDSLSFSVRESGQWHVSVMAVEVMGKEARLLPLWASNAGKTFAKEGSKPAFSSLPAHSAWAGADSNAVANPPLPNLKHYVAFFSQQPLPEIRPDEASDILQGIMAQRDAGEYRFQVFTVKSPEST
jgi:hypothetical protein